MIMRRMILTMKMVVIVVMVVIMMMVVVVITMTMILTMMPTVGGGDGNGLQANMEHFVGNSPTWTFRGQDSRYLVSASPFCLRALQSI